MSFLPSMPDASLIDVFKAYPELARPVHGFAQELMRGPSPLSEGERELIAAYVSALNGCAYCRAAHSAVAERFGVEPKVVDHLLDDIEGAAVPEKLRPVMHYVKKLNQAPDSVDQGDVQRILAAGWDERAVCHAALVCAWFNFMNRWVDGLGIEADPKMVQMAGKHLHEKGYRGILDFLPAEAQAD